MGYKLEGYADRIYIVQDDRQNPDYSTLKEVKTEALRRLRPQRDKWAYAIEQIVLTTLADLE